MPNNPENINTEANFAEQSIEEMTVSGQAIQEDISEENIQAENVYDQNSQDQDDLELTIPDELDLEVNSPDQIAQETEKDTTEEISLELPATETADVEEEPYEYDDDFTDDDDSEDYDEEDDEEEDDGSKEERIYAGFFVRLTAYLLDKVIIGVPILILRLILGLVSLGLPAGLLSKGVFFRFTPLDIVLYLVYTAYFFILTYVSGRTIGKRIMKIRVVSAEDRKPSWFEIFFRETFGRFLSAMILYIGYLIIAAGDEKEALHDHLADTRVVYDYR